MVTRDTYTKVHEDWKNQPDETTPVYAEDLEHIEQGIKDASDKRALKEIYNDDSINFGRKNDTDVGSYSTAEGFAVTASGYCSHAENYLTTASGSSSHAEGNDTYATGMCAHSEGYFTRANATYSHAEGQATTASGNAQHVQGKFNVEDTEDKYAHIVGGGTPSKNKNIHTIDWEGNAYYAGDVKNGVGVSLNSLKFDIDNMAAIAAGGAIAKVFDTKAELDVWMAVEGNPDTLVVGQNIYIKATNTPDYWWDGTGLQILETDKVEIESMTYNETMSILNASAEEVE